jgi:hypothetical protein
MSKMLFVFSLVVLFTSSCSESIEKPLFSDFINLSLEVENSFNEELTVIIFSIHNTSDSFYSTDCEVWMSIQCVESEIQESVFFDMQNGVFFSLPESTVIEVDANTALTEQFDIENLKLEEDDTFADLPAGEYSITCYLRVFDPGNPHNRIKSNTIVLNN